MTTTRKSFHAECRKAYPVPVQDLTDEQEKVCAATAIKVKGQWCASVPCDFETEDTGLFETHMRTVHDEKPVRGYGDTAESKALHRLWKAPRIPEEGRPFEPVGLEVGATVTWCQTVPTGEVVQRADADGGPAALTETVERSGQVWCAGHLSKSAWVIPFELLEGEVAVLVRDYGRPGRQKLERNATWTVKGHRDAA